MTLRFGGWQFHAFMRSEYYVPISAIGYVVQPVVYFDDPWSGFECIVRLSLAVQLISFCYSTIQDLPVAIPHISKPKLLRMLIINTFGRTRGARYF
jgi:hypothetical protein